MKANEIIKESRNELVDRIIENLENGYIFTKKQWNVAAFHPFNPLSGTYYRGGNRFRLMFAATYYGYKDPRWMTFKQAKKAKYHIKNDAKGILLEKWIFTKIVKEKNDLGEIEENEVELEHPYVRYFVVFNAEQVEGIEPFEDVPEVTEDETLRIADIMIRSSLCVIDEGERDEAFYSPKKDMICLPYRKYFKSNESFLATLTHEMGHSTGHPNRLNRKILNKFGSEEYAIEELNAEIASTFIMADLGVDMEEEIFNDHTNYIGSWIRVLKDDANTFFQACAEAEKISNFLFMRYLAQEQQENGNMEIPDLSA